MNNVNNIIKPAQVLQITNILRSLGLNTSYRGTKLINKIIQYVIKYNIEFITLNKIYSILCKEYGYSINSIRNNINYALSNRNITLSKANFVKVFGYDYYEKTLNLKFLLKKLVVL